MEKLQDTVVIGHSCATTGFIASFFYDEKRNNIFLDVM